MRASIARGLRTQRLEFGIGEDAGGLFGGVEDTIHERVSGSDAVTLEPEQHVGFPTHRTDFDDLVETEEARGKTAVDDVSESRVLTVEGFDDGGGVDPGGGAEGIAADDGIVRRDRRVRGGANFFAIFLEAGEVAIDQARSRRLTSMSSIG